MDQTDFMRFQNHLHIQDILPLQYFCFALRKRRKAYALQIFYILSCQAYIVLKFSPFIQNTAILPV